MWKACLLKFTTRTIEMTGGFTIDKEHLHVGMHEVQRYIGGYQCEDLSIEVLYYERESKYHEDLVMLKLWR